MGEFLYNLDLGKYLLLTSKCLLLLSKGHFQSFQNCLFTSFAILVQRYHFYIYFYSYTVLHLWMYLLSFIQLL